MRMYRYGWLLLLLISKFMVAQEQQLVSVVNNYNNWNWDSVFVAKNKFIRVAVVPKAGGRILEYKLGEVRSLWTEPSMMGKSFAPTDELKVNEWRNFGGYRIVPLPRTNCAIGKDGKKTKRWPPPAIWGDSPYTASIGKTTDGIPTIDLTSGIQELPVPTWFGKEKRFIYPQQIDERLQYKRSLHIKNQSSKVYITHTIVNKGNTRVNRGLLISSQHISESENGKRDGENFLAFVPFSKKIKLKNGKQYDIQLTPEQRWRYVNRNRRKLDKNNPEDVKKYYNIGTNWTGETAPGIFECHFDYDLMGGLHIISSEGWVCFVDKVRMTAFAKFLEPYNPARRYAEGCDVSIFNSGMSSGYLETEIHTPIFDIAPNKSANYTEVHAAAKVASLPILAINKTGIITKRLALKQETIHGEYGVFYAGTAVLHLFDKAGKIIRKLRLGKQSPLRALVVKEQISSKQVKKAALYLETATHSFLLDSLIVPSATRH